MRRIPGLSRCSSSAILEDVIERAGQRRADAIIKQLEALAAKVDPAGDGSPPAANVDGTEPVPPMSNGKPNGTSTRRSGEGVT